MKQVHVTHTPVATQSPRVVSWFSCGATSTVATKLTLVKYGPSVVVARIVLDGEHEDNARYAADCAEWFGVPIVELRSDRYRDTWEVWERRRFLNGPHGAPCTIELKKKVREAFQRVDDVQVFGYHFHEVERAQQFREQNHELTIATPLIDAHMTKDDCHGYMLQSGIKRPRMYDLGYENNNCIGCVKGGAGYWNKIREDFPEVFERTAALEESLGAHLIKLSTGRVSLRELPLGVGNYGTEDMSCGPLCQPMLL